MQSTLHMLLYIVWRESLPQQNASKLPLSRTNNAQMPPPPPSGTQVGATLGAYVYPVTVGWRVGADIGVAVGHGESCEYPSAMAAFRCTTAVGQLPSDM